MSYEDYTWLRYYEDLYHRQKKINNALAVQLGETTAKVGELEVALNRVVGSPFWRVLAPVRKVYGKIKGTGAGVGTGSTTAGAESTRLGNDSATSETGNIIDPETLFYNSRLEFFEDFYGQWIRKDPIEQKYADYVSDSGRNRVRESIYKVVYVEGLVGNKSLAEYAENAKWIILVSKHGKLANGFVERIGEAISAHPDAKIGYADEDFYINEPSFRRIEPNFKPDWSPDTLDSFYYFGHIAFIRADVACEIKWLASENPWKNVYDMFLQASEMVGKHYDAPEVMHITQILFHNLVEMDVDNLNSQESSNLAMSNDSYVIWKAACDSVKEDLAARKLIIGDTSEYDDIKIRAFERRNTPAQLIAGQFPHMNQICYSVPDDTKVSVLILSKDHPDVLRTCLESFVNRTDYKNLEFIVVDNGSTQDNKAIYESVLEEVVGDYPYSYIYEEMPFNFSKECNIAAKAASGQILLFMNDDMEIVQKDWLKLMVGYACLPHVGAVGAKLLYAGTDLIQHIGITNLAIGPSHKMVIYPDDQMYYYGRNTHAYDMLGVTGACLMVAADKFNEVGGFNEDFAVAYNDVDLTMKIAKSGYTNLQCNGALLYHYESLSRGQDEGNDEKWNRLLKEKQNLYLIHSEYFEQDPYYNPNLIGNHSNYLSSYDFGYNIHLKHEDVRQLDASSLAECTDDTYKISIDFAGIQAKHNLAEPEIAEVRGWSYIHGQDNARHAVKVVLKSETNGTLYEVNSDPSPRDDLENTFPDEKNIRLCGFVSKMLTSDLPKDTYVIGIEPISLNHDLTEQMSSGKVIFTENKLTV